MSANAGYNFLGTVIASGIIGYGIDYVFKTAPWGLLSFMVIGLVYATFLAQKAMNPPPESTPEKSDPEKD